MFVGHGAIMINILTKECDFEIANLHYKKIHNTVVNKHCIFKEQMIWNPSLFIFVVINSYLFFLLNLNW